MSDTPQVIVFDRFIVTKLLQDLKFLQDRIKMTGGCSIESVLWRTLGSITTLMGILVDHTDKMTLKQPIFDHLNPIESTIMSIRDNGVEAPYSAVMRGVKSIDTLLRVYTWLRDDTLTLGEEDAKSEREYGGGEPSVGQGGCRAEHGR